MDSEKVVNLLESVASGELTASQAAELLKDLPFTDLGFAKPDNHRGLRQGMPEVIFCPGKTPEQIVQIAQQLKAAHQVVLATRCQPDIAEKVLPLLPEAQYDALARLIVWGQPAQRADHSFVAVVCAGTADLPVAQEAAAVLSAASVRVETCYDVGVAGIHRLLANLPMLRQASVVIVVAGMDGALPSVVGGLLACPVIAVPTSVGYGASFQGLAALLTMLNSCATGITVVNIDNGFGAAAAAIRILDAAKKYHAVPSPASELGSK